MKYMDSWVTCKDTWTHSSLVFNKAQYLFQSGIFSPFAFHVFFNMLVLIQSMSLLSPFFFFLLWRD